VFGIVLIVTAVRMLFMGEGHVDPSRNFILRTMRRYFPLTTDFHGEHFFVRLPAPAGAPAGTTAAVPLRLMMTPLAPALIMVETTDLVFAVDSIPAIFAITADPFLIFTSNVFAILGLRSLYFALAGLLHTFRYLKHALSVVLLTVGIKMLAHQQIKHLLGPHFNLYLLATVILILAAGIGASLIEQRWRGCAPVS
jgi:tellurite resistance protein TerC